MNLLLKERRGITLIELLVAGTMGAILLVALGFLLNRYLRSDAAANSKIVALENGARLLAQISKVGRLSNGCTKTPTADPLDRKLSCDVVYEFGKPVVVTEYFFNSAEKTLTISKDGVPVEEKLP